MVKKRYAVPYTQALTSIGLERYLAGFSLVLLALGLALVFLFPQIALWLPGLLF